MLLQPRRVISKALRNEMGQREVVPPPPQTSCQENAPCCQAESARQCDAFRGGAHSGRCCGEAFFG